MKQFESVVAKDPLRLKKYETGGPSQSKKIYMVLAAIPILLILSVVFSFLGSVASLGDSDVTTTTYTTTSGQQSSDSTEVGEDGQPVAKKVTPVVGEVFTDRKKIANTFSKIQVGLRIMPSQNDEQGMILMKWTNEANALETKLGSKVEQGDHYFVFNETTDYFPVLRFSNEYVPYGNAAWVCIHLQWNKQEYRKMIDMYKTVQNFPTCYNAQNPKFRWQQNDPKLGQDFRVWTQQSANSASESACNSAGGAFRASTGKSDGSGKCYTYMVLKRVCLMMAYKEYPETASYTWEYRGGCYGSGSIAVYERAVLGQEYHFDNIPIEVREDESEYSSSHNAQVDAESTSDSQDSSSSGTASSSYRAQTSSTSTTTTTTTGGGISGFFSTLSTIFLVLAILAGILFAFLFFQTWKAAQAGPAMRHQEQVDED